MLSQDFQPLEWAQAALQSRNVEDGWRRAEPALRRFGFDNTMFMFDHPLGALDTPPPRTRRFGELIDEDFERRMRADPSLAAADPIARRFLSRDRPLQFWRGSALYRSMSEPEQRFFRNYERYGVKTGGVWPSHDRKRGTTHLFAIWTGDRSRGFREAITHNSTRLHLAITYFCEGLRVKHIRRKAGDGPLLSPRERECLLWVQAGKSSKEIGERLVLSDATVNEHVLNACRKLEASNRAQAAARAVMLDLIQP